VAQHTIMDDKQKRHGALTHGARASGCGPHGSSRKEGELGVRVRAEKGWGSETWRTIGHDRNVCGKADTPGIWDRVGHQPLEMPKTARGMRRPGVNSGMMSCNWHSSKTVMGCHGSLFLSLVFSESIKLKSQCLRYGLLILQQHFTSLYAHCKTICL